MSLALPFQKHKHKGGVYDFECHAEDYGMCLKERVQTPFGEISLWGGEEVTKGLPLPDSHPMPKPVAVAQSRSPKKIDVALDKPESLIKLGSMTTQELFDRYVLSAWFAGLSKKTQITYQHKLNPVILKLYNIKVGELNSDHFALVCEGKSNNECNHLFQILNAMLTWGSRELGLPKPNILYRTKAHKPVPKPAMTKDQAKALLAYRDKVGKNRQGVIANCMLAMYLTGMRCDELLNARTKDVHDTFVEITWAKGREKGLMSRAVGLNALSLSVLKWFPESDGHLVPVAVRSYKSFLKSWDSVRVAVNGCGNLTPHGARHGFATQMLRDGYDIYTISKMLGHSDIKTTERYLQMGAVEVASRFKGFEL